MADTLGVYNQALRLLESSRVNDTAPTSEATRTLGDAWPHVVRTALEGADWDFARRRAELSRVSPAPTFGYSYYYQIPADNCRVTFVSETGLPDDPLLRYEIDGTKIATDADRVFIVYNSSAYIDIPGLWTETFASYVAACLAKACIKLNPSAENRVMDELKRLKASALGRDGVQNAPEFRRSGQWSRAARYGGTSREQG